MRAPRDADYAQLRALEYSHLNLNIDKFGRRLGSSLTRERRAVSLLWEEKLADLVHFFQCMGLLWLMSTAWPWPFQWLRWSRFTLWFLLDAGSFFEHRDESSGFDHMAYAVLLLAVVAAAAAAYVLLERLVYLRNVDSRALWVRRLTFERVSARAAEFMYLPAAVLGARMLVCRDGGLVHLTGSLGTVTCWGGAHYTLLVASAAVLLPPLVAVPFLVARAVRKAAIFDGEAMHEKYLASREMEYLVGVNELYEADRFYLFASYTRRYAQARAWRCASRLALVVIVYALGPDVAGTSALGVQAAAFCVAVALPWLGRLWWREYRVRSSNLLGRILEALLFANAVVGIFSAGGAKTSLLVDSTLSVLLAMVNLSGLGLYVVVAAWTAVSGASRWPVTESDVAGLLEKDVEMLRLINDGKRVVDDSVDCPGEFVSKRDLAELIRGLDRHRREARERDHVLAWTLQDLTEELALVYENSESLSLLPNPALERVLDGLHGALAQKRFDRLLLHPAKAETLQKLLVLRGLLGDDYTYGNREEWHEEDPLASHGPLGLGLDGVGGPGGAARGGAGGGAGGRGGAGGAGGGMGELTVRLHRRKKLGLRRAALGLVATRRMSHMHGGGGGGGSSGGSSYGGGDDNDVVASIAGSIVAQSAAGGDGGGEEKDAESETYSDVDSENGELLASARAADGGEEAVDTASAASEAGSAAEDRADAP